MEKFKKIVGIAAPFTRINVDTDFIIPAENLKTIKNLNIFNLKYNKALYFVFQLDVTILMLEILRMNHLKENIDKRIEVFTEMKRDKNKLRDGRLDLT